MKLSIIICAYNEKSTLPKVIKRIYAHPVPGWSREVIIVDNASTDGTTELIRALRAKGLKKIFHRTNRGKGASIKSGIKAATGDYLAIQDADLEYHPKELIKLTRAADQGARVIFGSRILNQSVKYQYVHLYWGARLISWLTNWLYGSHLTDVATATKMFYLPLIKKIPLTKLGFELEFELTCKVLAKKVPIIEVPISYTPRTYAQGKKLTVWDGIKSAWIIIRQRLA